MRIITASKIFFPKITDLLLLCAAAGTELHDNVSVQHGELVDLFGEYQALTEENQRQAELIAELQQEVEGLEAYATELYDRWEDAAEYPQ